MLKIDKAVEGARIMLQNLNIDLTDDNYSRTPDRLVEVLTEFTSSLNQGYDLEIQNYFDCLFPKHKDRKNGYRGMLVQSPVRVYSLCSHHLLPVIYDIAFAYIPNGGGQIGFSKIVRILNSVAKRPMNQEDFTQEVVDLFKEKMKPKGLAMVVSGIHMCMKMRGVHSDAVNRTSAVSGDFKDYERTRDEFLTLALNFNPKI